MKHSYNLRCFAQLGVALVLLLLLVAPGASAQAVRLYYTQGSGSNAALDAAKAVNPDGTAGATLASGSTNFRQPAGIAFDQANGFVYVADHYLGATGIVRYNADGTNRTVIVPPTAGATYNGLALDVAGNRLFFTQGSATNPALDALKVVSLATGFAVTTLASGAASFTQPTGIALDATNSFLYVADQYIGGGGILRFSLTGAGRTVVVPALANAAYNGLALDVASNRIFFTQGSADATLDALKVVSLATGFAVTTLASGAASFTQPTGIALDATNSFLYVADQFVSTGGILRFSTAGASRTVIVPPTAGATYNGLALAVSVAVAPTVTTAAATSITTTSAVLGGSVTADGGAAVTDRGVVYSSTNTTPTTADTKAANGTGTGSFSATISGLAPATKYYVRAYATNSAGTSYGSVEHFATAGPPVLLSPADGSQTAIRTPTYSGTAQAGGVVGVYLDVTGSGSFSLVNRGGTIATADGTFSVLQPTNLAPGRYGVIVGLFFTNGEAVYSAATYFTVTPTSLLVDISSSTGASGSTSSASPFAYTVTFSEAVSGFVASDVVVDNGTLSGFAGSGTTYTFNVTPAGNGAVTVNVPANVAIDANNMGNSAATQFTITYSQPVTAAPVVIAPANGSLVSTNTPTYTGTAPAGSTVTVIVDGTAIGTTTASASGGWSLPQPTALAQGSHTVRATAQTSGSAVSANSNTNTFTVDTVAPQTSIVSGPPANTNSTTATFSFSSNESPVTYQASLDGAGFTATANPRVYTGLTDGSHTLSVRAADAAGNVDATPATYSWTVDTTSPTALISSTATSPTSTSPIPVTVTFSEAVSGFVASDVVLDNGTLSGFAGSGTTYTFNVTPAGNGAVTVNVPANVAIDANNTGNSAATQFTIQYNAPITVAVWNGSMSTNWFTPENWTGGVPTATIDATIPAGAPRYPLLEAGTASAKSLFLSTGAGLAQNGGVIDLKGSFVNNGIFSATGGSVALTGTVSQAVGGSAPSTFWNLSVGANGASLTGVAAVQRVLTLAGSLTTDANSFTLLSNAAGTAMVVNTGGTVVGNATVQRYINPSLNAGAGYRHYSSPVANSTVADLATTGFGPVVNGSYNTSATPTTVKPYPTVFGYDQSRLATTSNNLAAFDKGWFSPASTTAALAVGRGYTVNLRANQVVDFVGTLNNGDQTLSLARNSGSTAAAAGWQLVGNRYPAPLDFSLVAASDRPNLDAAIYVFESTSQYNGQYRSYINGLGNPVVTMGQGFFVRVSEGQTTGSLTFRNSQRLTTYQDPTFRRSTTETRPLVQLQLGGPAAGLATDNTHIYFEAGATAGLDSQFDAVKLANSTGLNLSSLALGSELSINGLPLPVSTSLVVPLRVRVPATGTYTLTALQVLNFSPNAQPFLRDLQLNTLTDLHQQPSYTFTQDAANSTPRFELVFARQVLATASATLVAQVAVYPNPATKAVFLELPAGLSRKAVTAALVDALGRVVVQQVLPAGRATHTLPLANVATGVYSLRLQTEAGMVVKKLVVE
ncbi:beta strand repeat-containing protein [Hymenobacter sp. IS2118]|uniref:beta strand repeat-containing protein n=1 Tax=Hymenobacter sp. IS2118 TaxID=1505605 RepID=UPI000554F520|nr:Ig-like domain-containing protein [Hymenobacter sp. IS2118]